jgi:hypothetical protein
MPVRDACESFGADDGAATVLRRRARGGRTRGPGVDRGPADAVFAWGFRRPAREQVCRAWPRPPESPSACSPAGMAGPRTYW